MFDFEALDDVDAPAEESRPEWPAGGLEKVKGKEFIEELSRRRATVDEEGQTFESVPRSPIADFRQGELTEIAESGEYKSINATTCVAMQEDSEAVGDHGQAAENWAEEAGAVEEIDAAAAESREVEAGVVEEIEATAAENREAENREAENREAEAGAVEEIEATAAVNREVEAGAAEEIEAAADENREVEAEALEEIDAAAANNRELEVRAGEEAEALEEVQADEEEEDEDDLPPLKLLKDWQVQSDIFVDDVIVELSHLDTTTAENVESTESDLDDEMPPLQQIPAVPSWSSRRHIEGHLTKPRSEDERDNMQEIEETEEKEEDLPPLEDHDEPEAFKEASRQSHTRSGSRHKRKSRGCPPQDETRKKDQPPPITKAHAKLPWVPKADEVLQPRAYAWSVYRPKADADEASMSSQGASSSSMGYQNLQRNHGKVKKDVSTKGGQSGKSGIAMNPEKELTSKGGKSVKSARSGKSGRAESGAHSPSRRRGIDLQPEQQPLSHPYAVERNWPEESWKPSLSAKRRPKVREHAANNLQRESATVNAAAHQERQRPIGAPREVATVQPRGTPRERAQELKGYHQQHVAYHQERAANDSQLPVGRRIHQEVAQELQGRKLRVWRPQNSTPPTTSHNFAPAQRTSRLLEQCHRHYARHPEEDGSEVESLDNESNSCEEIEGREAEPPPLVPPPSVRIPVRRLQAPRLRPGASVSGAP